jgi:hypothetical protein
MNDEQHTRHRIVPFSRMIDIRSFSIDKLSEYGEAGAKIETMVVSGHLSGDE